MSRKLLRQIFADLEYLGIIEKYGTCCFFINASWLKSKASSFRRRITCLHRRRRSRRPRTIFAWRKGSLVCQAKYHSYCLVFINKSVLPDFGLGNVQCKIFIDFIKLMPLPVSELAKRRLNKLCEAHPSFRCSLSYVADLHLRRSIMKWKRKNVLQNACSNINATQKSTEI